VAESGLATVGVISRIAKHWPGDCLSGRASSPMQDELHSLDRLLDFRYLRTVLVTKYLWSSLLDNWAEYSPSKWFPRKVLRLLPRIKSPLHHFNASRDSQILAVPTGAAPAVSTLTGWRVCCFSSGSWSGCSPAGRFRRPCPDRRENWQSGKRTGWDNKGYAITGHQDFVTSVSKYWWPVCGGGGRGGLERLGALGALGFWGFGACSRVGEGGAEVGNWSECDASGAESLGNSLESGGRWR